MYIFENNINFEQSKCGLSFQMRKKKLKCKLVSKKKKLKCKLNIAWSTKVPLESSYFSHPPTPFRCKFWVLYWSKNALLRKKNLTHNQTFQNTPV